MNEKKYRAHCPVLQTVDKVRVNPWLFSFMIGNRRLAPPLLNSGRQNALVNPCSA